MIRPQNLSFLNVRPIIMEVHQITTEDPDSFFSVSFSETKNTDEGQENGPFGVC